MNEINHEWGAHDISTSFYLVGKKLDYLHFKDFLQYEHEIG